MRIQWSNRSLRKIATLAKLEQKEILAISEIESWQSKVLAIESPQGNYWLVDSTADAHICNDQALITKYQKPLLKIDDSISDAIFPSKGRIWLWHTLNDRSEGLVLNLCNVYHPSYSLCNLISLGLLNNNGIFYDNKNKTLYKIKSQ